MSYESYQSPGVQPVLVPTYSYAHWGQRVGAYIIDQLVSLAAMIPFVIGLVLFFVGSEITSYTDYNGDEVIDDWSLRGLGWVGIAVMVFGVLFMIAVTLWNIVVRQGRTGASIGKSALGLVLVKESTGKPIGAGMSFLRQLLHFLDSAVCYLGFLWPLWDAKRQTLADKCVSSVVITTR